MLSHLNFLLCFMSGLEEEFLPCMRRYLVEQHPGEPRPAALHPPEEGECREPEVPHPLLGTDQLLP